MLKNIRAWLIFAVIAAICLMFHSFKYNNGLISFLLAHDTEETEDESHEKLLRVGVRDDITNFSLYNSMTGKYYGLEDEIADELARRMGYDAAEFITVNPVKRVELLNKGEVDVVIGLYSVTDERSKEVDFSPVYYTDNVQLIAEKTTGFTDMADLKGKSIAILNGSTAPMELSEALVENGIINNSLQIESFLSFNKMDSYKNMFDALEIGNVDALVADGAIAHHYMSDDRVILHNLCTTSYAAATKKGSELTDSVASAMQEMLEDGTIKRIEKDWGF